MADLPRALCVHGIAYGGEPYWQTWQQALWRAGVPLVCVGAPWSSTGTISGDIARILFQPGYRRRIVREVREALERYDPHILIGHSMGQPVAIEAARAAGYSGPIVTIGGPLSHPVYGKALRLAGMGEYGVRGPVVHLWNRDDGVCASPVFGVRHPAWMGEAQIAIAGAGGWVGEHPAELYLDHSRTAEHVLAMLGNAPR